MSTTSPCMRKLKITAVCYSCPSRRNPRRTRVVKVKDHDTRPSAQDAHWDFPLHSSLKERANARRGRKGSRRRATNPRSRGVRSGRGRELNQSRPGGGRRRSAQARGRPCRRRQASRDLTTRGYHYADPDHLCVEPARRHLATEPYGERTLSPDAISNQQGTKRSIGR